MNQQKEKLRRGTQCFIPFPLAKNPFKPANSLCWQWESLDDPQQTTQQGKSQIKISLNLLSADQLVVGKPDPGQPTTFLER